MIQYINKNSMTQYIINNKESQFNFYIVINLKKNVISQNHPHNTFIQNQQITRIQL